MSRTAGRRQPSLRFLAAVGVIAGGVILPAAAASAHAVLLNTDPPPQTTVTRAPPRIRLQFSESVEATFGAVRVFDSKAHRADTGRLARTEGGREVDVPVHNLQPGTYAVTWRVVSDDGHPVSGSFVFFVGAPSTNAIAVPAAQTGDATVNWAFGAVRFLWFALFFAVIGLAVTRRWIWTPALADADLTRSVAADRFSRRFGPALVAAWAGLAVAHAASLVFQAANASGFSLATAARPATLSQILGTSYGHYWLEAGVLIGLAGIPTGVLARRPHSVSTSSSPWLWALMCLLSGVAVTAALNGHARTLGHPLVGVPSLAVHLLALGVWIGGLATLLVLGLGSLSGLDHAARTALVLRLVSRFGRLALGALAAVLVTGAANAVLDLGSPHDLFTTPYGRALLVKLLLLEAALVLAARHAWFVPTWLGRPGSADEAVASFRRSGYAELATLVVAVGIAAGLMVMVPGRSLALAGSRQVDVERRVGPYRVQLALAPSQLGPNQLHLSFLDARGRAASAVNSATAVLLGGPQAAPVTLRSVSPASFVGDVSLPRSGTYRLEVSGGGQRPATTVFAFSVRASQAGDTAAASP